jgi:tetratricopeptide (TPR) repeat protein
VYSLGATLYVVLTGRKPFERTDSTEPVIPRPEDLIPPRQLNPRTPAALDAVCRKAMAVRPADRYQSPLDLAADVERWLADEPVTTYRDPWPVRAGRWARRHRTPVAVASVFLVTAAVGLGLGSALLWREERRTRSEYERAEREHQAAERNFDTARTTILEMGRRIEDIETGQADPRRSDRKRREALDGARKEFERFVTENPDDLVLKRQLAALHRYAGNVSRLLGDYAEANAAYKASIALWGELADREPDEPSHRDNLALTLRDAATVQKRSGRLKDAAATLDRAAALAEEVKGRVPAVWYQRTLGGTLLDRADVEYRLGNFAAAEQTAGQAIALFDALKQVPAGQTNATDPIFAGLAALVRGEALREQGKDREALEALDDAAARADKLGGGKGDRNVRHLTNKTRLARAVTRARSADATAEAVRELGQVIEGAEKLAADFPQTPFYQEVLADALVRRGRLATRSAPAEAAADSDRALAITRGLIDKFGQQPDDLGLRAQAFLGKGQLLLGEGKKSDAATEFDRAVTVFKIGLGKDPDNFLLRRGLGEAEEAARANPKPGPAKP